MEQNEAKEQRRLCAGLAVARNFKKKIEDCAND